MTAHAELTEAIDQAAKSLPILRKTLTRTIALARREDRDGYKAQRFDTVGGSGGGMPGRPTETLALQHTRDDQAVVAARRSIRALSDGLAKIEAARKDAEYVASFQPEAGPPICVDCEAHGITHERYRSFYCRKAYEWRRANNAAAPKEIIHCWALGQRITPDLLARLKRQKKI